MTRGRGRPSSSRKSLDRNRIEDPSSADVPVVGPFEFYVPVNLGFGYQWRWGLRVRGTMTIWPRLEVDM